jgi:hypothetical protein
VINVIFEVSIFCLLVPHVVLVFTLISNKLKQDRKVNTVNFI